MIQVEDEDGDALVAGAGDIVINVGDDIPQHRLATPAALQVDEDALADANADTPVADGEVDFGGQASDSLDLTVVFSVGQDQPGTYGFTAGAVAALDALPLTSNQVAITHTQVGDTITGSAGRNPIYTIQVTAAWSSDLHADRPDRPSTPATTPRPTCRSTLLG